MPNANQKPENATEADDSGLEFALELSPEQAHLQRRRRLMDRMARRQRDERNRERDRGQER